jgi:hypothetical protein
MIRRDRRPLIDGTLLGPDHLAELVAWHLHRLGAAKAEVVVFVSGVVPNRVSASTWVTAKLVN